MATRNPLEENISGKFRKLKFSSFKAIPLSNHTLTVQATPWKTGHYFMYEQQRAVSPEPMLCAHVTCRLMGNFSQRTRHVVSMRGRESAPKDWFHRKSNEPFSCKEAYIIHHYHVFVENSLRGLNLTALCLKNCCKYSWNISVHRNYINLTHLTKKLHHCHCHI